MRRPAGFGTLLSALCVLVGGPASADPPIAGPAAAGADRQLHITVNPTSFAPAGETLEEKLARRMRDADVMFRSICRGCGRRDGLVDLEAGPFEPQRSLDAARVR